jgi:hypothetical protein
MAFLTLPANHYAATWSETHQIYKIDEGEYDCDRVRAQTGQWD